jgi:hypothetical protein
MLGRKRKPMDSGRLTIRGLFSSPVQAKMPLRNRNRRVRWQPSLDLCLAGGFNRLPQHLVVPLTRHTIKNHSGKLQIRIESLKPQHHRSYAARTLRRVNDKHHRQPQQFSDLRAAANLGAPILPIEQAHQSFRDDYIGSTGSVAQNTPVGRDTQHPRIQIPRCPAAYPGMMARIQEVRPTFKRLHDKPTLS